MAHIQTVDVESLDGVYKAMEFTSSVADFNLVSGLNFNSTAGAAIATSATITGQKFSAGSGLLVWRSGGVVKIQGLITSKGNLAGAGKSGKMHIATITCTNAGTAVAKMLRPRLCVANGDIGGHGFLTVLNLSTGTGAGATGAYAAGQSTRVYIQQESADVYRINAAGLPPNQVVASGNTADQMFISLEYPAEDLQRDYEALV